MARPNRAVLADAGVTVVLGVAFVASTAGATGARRLDGLGWALVAMGAASGVWDLDLLEIGSVAIMLVSGWVLGVVLAAPARLHPRPPGPDGRPRGGPPGAGPPGRARGAHPHRPRPA